jgi:hypothetical protein
MLVPECDPGISSVIKLDIKSEVDELGTVTSELVHGISIPSLNWELLLNDVFLVVVRIFNCIAVSSWIDIG